MSDQYIVGKNPCKKCQEKGNDTAGDNFHWYGEGQGGYCHACGFTVPSDEWLEENKPVNLREMEYEVVGKEFNEEVLEQLKKQTSFKSKGYRGITDKTSQYFGVMYSYDTKTGQVDKSYYPVTQGIMEGKTVQEALTGFKVRKHPKDFSECIGKFSKESDLFMQWRFPTHRSMLMVCAGEVDALSAYQMLKDNHDKRESKFDEIAVVSPLVGEGGAADQLRNHFEWLSQFNKIIVCMDNDEAGKKATKEIVEVLPRGKAYVMPIRYKDVNEYLKAGDQTSFINDFWGHRPWTPSGVHSSSTLYNAAVEYSQVTKITLPPFMKKAEKMFGGGLVKNEISIIFAQTSQGKSLFVDSMVDYWVMHEPEEIVGVMSLEASKDKYATNIFSRHLGVNLMAMDGEERKEFLLRDSVKTKIENFLTDEEGRDRFYVYDSRGSSIEEVKESILEMVIKLGVTLLVIDPYSDLMSGMDLAAQEEFVAWLKKVVLQYNKLSVVLVCHTRKLNPNSEGVTESDIIGSSTVMKSSAHTISIERDKLNEDPYLRNVSKVVIHKNRHGSLTGLACEVFFDFKTGQLVEWQNYQEENPHLFVKEK